MPQKERTHKQCRLCEPHNSTGRAASTYIWPAEGLKKIKQLEEQGKAAQEKALAERVMGTSPSLELKEYAGIYNSEMYGDLEIKFEDGKLTAHFGSNFSGVLCHWNYNTFQATWRDPVMGKAFLAAIVFGVAYELPKERKEIALDPKILELYVGEYRSLGCLLIRKVSTGRFSGETKQEFVPSSV